MQFRDAKQYNNYRVYYLKNIERERERNRIKSREAYYDPIKGPIIRYKKNVARRVRFIEERIALLELLGGKCSRCGITDTRCLQIDHRNGGGKKDHKEKGSQIVHYYLTHQDEIHKLDILCANCNWIKRADMNETPRIYGAKLD